MSRWVGGEGWATLGHSGAKVEVVEKAMEREKRERIVSWEGKLGEVDFLPT